MYCITFVSMNQTFKIKCKFVCDNIENYFILLNINTQVKVIFLTNKYMSFCCCDSNCCCDPTDFVVETKCPQEYLDALKDTCRKYTKNCMRNYCVHVDK